jgi:hypothetical protein
MQESAFNATADANPSERRQFLCSSLLLSIPALLPLAPSSAMAAATHVPTDLKFEKPLNGDSPTTRESPRTRT